jgi:hypothetical protein
MPLLADFPVVFVHYPTGAGGWFLSSLLHYSFDQIEPFTFDQVGSGHSNRSIQYINNFYKDFLQTTKGKDIIYETNYDAFSKEDRIAYIKESLMVAPDANKNIPQVISIHCQNINLFLEALPHAKCVQITISDKDLLKCTFNYLFKILAITPFNFETFCAERGIINDQFEIAKEKIKNLNAENLKWFEWAVPFIEGTNKSVENNIQFKDRILELPYTKYMNYDHDLVLEEIIEFANPDCSLELFQDLSGYLLSYRVTQPRFPL